MTSVACGIEFRKLADFIVEPGLWVGSGLEGRVRVWGEGGKEMLGSCVREEGEGGVGFTQLEEEGQRLS